MFHGPFVLQTFTASLAAFQGACKIEGLNDPNQSVVRLYGGLVLAAAAVSIALMVFNLVSHTFLT